MTKKTDRPEPPMFRLFESASNDEGLAVPPPKPPSPATLLESKKSRERQLRLLDKVADAFGWEHGDAYDSRMVPPAEWAQKYHDGWAVTEQIFGSKNDPIMMTARQKVEKRLYDPGAFNNNWDHLRRHDPENMRIVDAVVEEYGICLYWDTLVNAEKEKLPFPISKEDHEKFDDMFDAIEAVRSQVGAHYAQLLRERGYSNSAVKKILGGAVAGYILAANKMGLAYTPIYPPKVDSPDEMMRHIDAYAEKLAGGRI